MLPITENLFCYQDTCNVYVLRSGSKAVLIDFGSGDVLDELPALNVERVTDILLTHHHRDQGQGLQRAVDVGINIWVPHMEQELFTDVAAHWQGRALYNNYDVRQDRFSLLESIPITGTLHDCATCHFGDYDLMVVPTPGHTVGSISLFTKIDKQRIAFTGDLIAAPGKVWSLAATQWTYNGGEGLAMSIPSLLDVKSRQPNLLLPSHGEPIREPDQAIDLLTNRLCQLIQYREQNKELPRFLDNPYTPITPHLLWNQSSVAFSYVLLSNSGKALLIDYGYDFILGFASSTERAARRPWLYSLKYLKQKYGVHKIDVVMPTHHHDDHIAGFNLLR
ncbi:MAG: MBL fold metallo-hydrolase, partial [Anaerolineae bacterium]|nr:MBL fold metallo-hydrolase [Anaerolineae bacterium]